MVMLSPIRPTTPVAATAVPRADPARSRVASVDALRGIAIFSIIGADQLAWAARGMAADDGSIISSMSRSIAAQFEHGEWEGFRFYDLILPLLIFVTGVTIVFSLGKDGQFVPSPAVYWRVLRRAALLYAFGVLYYAGATWPDIRLLGVLQRIAICYLVASLLVLHIPLRALGATVVVLLLGYWAVFELVSVDEVRAGTYVPGANLAHWFDRHFLPGRLWYETWDPEGLFSTLPAICTCLLGVFAGCVLSRKHLQSPQKATLLILFGLAALALGTVWGLRFPVIKALWTSSYVLVAAGYSFLLLGLAYWLTETVRASVPMLFVWIGSNAIALYLVEGFVGFAKVAERLVGSDAAMRLDALRPGSSAAVFALVGLALAILLARVLYARRLLLRV